LPHHQELVSIQIVTWNSEAFIDKCLAAVFKQSYTTLQVLVLDNASTDRTEQIVQSYGSAVAYVRFDHNTGFSQAHNIGFSLAKGNYILVMNPDVLLTPTYVEKVVAAMRAAAHIGAVAGKLYRWPQYGVPTPIDSTGIQFHRYKRVFDDSTIDVQELREIFGVTGACALYNRQMLEAVKIKNEYFDEDFFAYYEDVDLAWRARRLGWKSLCVPDAIAYHHRGAAQTAVPLAVRRLIFRNRYLVLLKNDSFTDVAKVLPVFLLFEGLRHLKVLVTLPSLLLQWPIIVKYLPVMLRKRRLMREKSMLAVRHHPAALDS
jgi:GT2 family glycosyltransferase